MIPAFPKIFTLGMRETERLYIGDVEVTEKIDGSQFSFGKIDGELHIRSKGAAIYDTSNKMFAAGVDFVKEIEFSLPDNVVFHGEYLNKPRHNTLAYGRVPQNHFMLFGVREMPDRFISDHSKLEWWAERIGCEPIPLLYRGAIEHGEILTRIDSWLSGESVLGEAQPEGVVIKNYAESALIGGHVIPIVAAKFVSEKFKETHKVAWKKTNPQPLERIAEAFCTEARWEKVVQHLRDDDALTHSPKDIGPLLKGLNQDIEGECQSEIKDALWSMFRKDILRSASRGFPEWYKRRLAGSAPEEADQQEAI